MDWNAAIERNREALRRVLTALFAMAHVDSVDARPEPLPRILHRAVLRLLRPAEAAARRLVIMAARVIAVDLSASLPVEPARGAGSGGPQPGPRRIGIHPETPLDQAVQGSSLALHFPLFDPPLRWRPARPRMPACFPRISVPGVVAPSPIPSPPNPFDEIDAARLALRLRALGAALDDLPKHARRFARWKARRDALAAGIGATGATRLHRIWPLRPGRPLGRHSRRDPRPAHEVHAILDVVHGLALRALEPADTS